VRYRLAPQFPFPAAVEDSTAVYTTALKTHAPRKIAIYGTSAGAVLGAQTAVQIRKNSQPLPAVLGFFSGYVDLARYGDSRFLYGSGGLKDFSAMIEPLKGLGWFPYVETTTARIPCFRRCMRTSRIPADSVHDFDPRSLSQRHRGLSSRASANWSGRSTDGLRRAAHAFWYKFDLPESKEALEAQASFLDQHLG